MSRLNLPLLSPSVIAAVLLPSEASEHRDELCSLGLLLAWAVPLLTILCLPRGLPSMSNTYTSDLEQFT